MSGMSIKDLFKDEYAVKARFFPALVTALPIVVLMVLPLMGNGASFLSGMVWKLKYGIVMTTGMTMFLMIIWLWAFLIRGIAKWVELLVFNNGERYPTTNLLMWKNLKFPREYKRQIHNAIQTDFSVELLDVNSELEDELTARKLITVAVDRIRDKVGDGRIVLQYNMGYGFMRNLVAGSFLAVMPSFVIFVLGVQMGWRSGECFVGVMLSLFYIIVLLISKPVLRFLAGLYAKTLISEYMSLR